MNARLLLVEDSDVNADMLIRRLVRRDFVISRAVDGIEAVAKAKSEQPDLILMDLSLPRMDGWEATKRIKDDPETTHIPIIALSAHALLNDQERAFAAGCVAFESKPVDLSSLLNTMNRYLRATSPT